uniref:Zinc finger CCHC domain-containing protein 17 n=1 Tax=Mola mola TaxID=94237 RepID=A0A3Q3X591_MOLML
TPAGLEGLPPMYSIAKGEVVSVQTYGAFVRLSGYKKEGLVHVSEMSASRVENASEIVDVGEQVWIKVIGREIRGDKVKLSFSMKAVNQGTGRDLDPNNVNAEQDARRRRQFRDHTGNRITLEAVLNTTCSKCGCKGMKQQSCLERAKCKKNLCPFFSGCIKTLTYCMFVPDQEKKMKKKRKRDRKQSGSDSSSSSECKSKKRGREHSADREDKKKKKHKKHKSHKHS